MKEEAQQLGLGSFQMSYGSLAVRSAVSPWQRLRSSCAAPVPLWKQHSVTLLPWHNRRPIISRHTWRAPAWRSRQCSQRWRRACPNVSLPLSLFRSCTVSQPSALHPPSQLARPLAQVPRSLVAPGPALPSSLGGASADMDISGTSFIGAASFGSMPPPGSSMERR